jgi:hypothetical protein
VSNLLAVTCTLADMLVVALRCGTKRGKKSPIKNGGNIVTLAWFSFVVWFF